ncbi:M23 family metallopeptidase [Demequina sp. TTPB684]|uniref:M23 family metallopeptidase n=1 Tax=unclassified Demequina TaxID=2620311 RepID=UPI001CF5E4F2|nr:MULTISPECIES: M23 family metallopeptidase [unclassified Demequina]MCB2413362.1 M23 family metallopeptidase [Demequina sp. TTPB684]UPU87375.1 M23 family metallopeptidase [Demequina sp. TMPB413]
MGTTYAIDLIPVDHRGRSAPWSWRAALATEPPGEFVGFGEAVLAPAAGRVVIAHDGEADHVARRSQLSLLAYMAGQPARLRTGPGAIAGNHVVIAMNEGGPFVLVAHLREGTVRVAVGDTVRASQAIGECGNSGNSTQPHVHIQVTDSVDWERARGLPIAFDGPLGVHLPAESEVVEVPRHGSRQR